ncbi:MAG TPA: ABC transporter substrate-binding protein [Candidatus Eisenbacteria bacterium]|nr:ABC transporter substrate-binding protein [Candidatus Eisenbacteria bacterium]
MNSQREGWTRRAFLNAAALAGVESFLRLTADAGAAEPPSETASLKLLEIPALCWAPQYVAEDLLRAEGFSRVQYIKREIGPGMFEPLRSGEANLSMGIAGPLMIEIEAGAPIVLLAGVHVGCYELFGTGEVRTIRDLKGKSVGVQGIGGGAHVTLATMLAYVGVDPRKEINWIARPFAESMRLLDQGKIDAYMAFPPEPQELRAKNIGRTIVNTTLDKPWSQYFCCMLAANAEFVRRNPAAVKRALRAILKTADLCAAQPKQAAKSLIEKGLARDYNYAVDALKTVRYDRWHEYDPEDTVRFYALRLREAGMIKSSPQKLIAQGADWRFLRELRKELKA